MNCSARFRLRRGFTLIELLVVILIILLVSAATLPIVVPALTHRQVGEGARLVLAALAGARDSAIRAGEARGIRLLPDPSFPGSIKSDKVALAYNRFIPIEPGPVYSEGRVTVWASVPTALYPVNPGAPLLVEPFQALRVEEEPYNAIGLPNSPTSWFWNIRLGDKIRLGSGRLYTVVGPIWLNPWSSSPTQNTELFVNVGPPGTLSPIARANVNGVPYNPEYLLLVNGQDDNGNGYVDEGFDGFDNNFNGVRDIADVSSSATPPFTYLEWEQETFSGEQFRPTNALGATGFNNQPYTILRRPVPSPGAREITLPSDVVIDATTWGSNLERSCLPVDPYSLTCDIMVAPNGEVVQTGATSSNASPLGLPFYHFWLTEREDVVDGNVIAQVPYFLPMPQGTANYPNAADTVPRFLKADRRLVTLFPKTGQILTTTVENFDGTNVRLPYLNAQLGLPEEVK